MLGSEFKMQNKGFKNEGWPICKGVETIFNSRNRNPAQETRGLMIFLLLILVSKAFKFLREVVYTRLLSAPPWPRGMMGSKRDQWCFYLRVKDHIKEVRLEMHMSCEYFPLLLEGTIESTIMEKMIL